MTSTLNAAEQATATDLRTQIAPLLANGVVCAMRDQPSDPAGYMAEFLAVSGAGGAQAVLDRRKFGQECARLDSELVSLKEQLTIAREERARRLPSSSDAEALRNAAVASASWNEVRRLKRLVRSMKIKISEPLSASDWPISEGVLLVQGGFGLGGENLCRQLSADFGVSLVETEGNDDPLGNVQECLKERPNSACLLYDYLTPAKCRDQIDLITRRVGKPTALILVTATPYHHAARIIDGDEDFRKEKAARSNRLQERADHTAYDWANQQLPTLEAGAREASLPVLRASSDSYEFNEQMTSFLVACSSV